jgi:cytochrome aa3-600 menaquinol oxidase subunit 1
MLAVAPADYQYHNSYFLISHFHYVLVGGTVFGCLAGLYYWWPKMFGFKLDERQGKLAFWLFNIGFNVCFFPQYFVGLMGMTRRIYTYPAGLGWTPYNFISTVGAYMMGVGFLIMVYNIWYSVRNGERDVTGDIWNGRTLEWSISSPAPHYNFARIPEVDDVDAWWHMKQRKRKQPWELRPLKPIHMPNNSGRPFIMSIWFFIAGFGLVFEWYWMGIIGLLGVLYCMVKRSFEYDDHHYIQVDEIERTESAAGRA